ncbi:MAG: heme exporter protein CcmD [Pseudomonadota bacterium]|jgi:heme exporter protein CcmD
MNHWPFVISAYGITFAAISALVLWSWLAMRGSERK